MHSFARRLIVVLGAAATSLLAGAATAQPTAPKTLKSFPPGTNVSAKLADGSVIFGRLERMDADSVVVVGTTGRLAMRRDAVRTLRDAGVAHAGADGSITYWYPNANTTRLFFGPTGRTLAAGTGYLADHEVIMASVSVGLTDRLQLGAGSFIIPNTDFWFVLPKVGIVHSDEVNVAVGALYGGVRGNNGGVAYAVGTLGGADRSFTAGIGRGISGTTVEGKPVFMLGGETRVSRRAALVTENYFGAGSSEGLLMYGVRFLGETMTVDLAMMNSARDIVFPGAPYVGFVIKW